MDGRKCWAGGWGELGTPSSSFPTLIVQGRVPTGGAGAWDPEELIRHDFATL